MGLKIKKPVPPCKANTGSELGKAVAAVSDGFNTKPLGEFQEAFLASRFGLDGVRARVVAELAWGART